MISDDEDSAGDDGISNSDLSHLHNDYTILKEEEINRRQQKDISTISKILSVPKGTACSLLLHYKWSVDNVSDQWFSDENRARKAVGLSPKEVNTNGTDSLSFDNKSSSCGICFDDFTINNPFIVISDLCVGHLFCTDCVKTYINVSINDGGASCLSLRCPAPKCNALIDLDLVDRLVSDVDKAKYHGYLRRSYVENSRKRKWCNGPGCEFAIEYDDDDDDTCDNYDVTCECSNKFCWNCSEESHSPIDCDTVKEWNKKNASEANNIVWISAFTKPCPKCKMPIEKNQGCNHMMCRPPCGFRFCWACLGPLGSGHKCNNYKESGVEAKDKRKKEELEKNKELARNELQKYAHYYARWASNHSSRKKALIDLNRARNEHIEKLLSMYVVTKLQLNCVTEAWEQIVECRRVLKWSYAFGYYMPESYNKKKKNLFEFLQGEAESSLEKLHHCAESEMVKYLNHKYAMNLSLEASNEFARFRKKLTDLTGAVKNFFKNLVKALENNLSEVEGFVDN